MDDFRTLVAATKAASATDMLPAMVEHGITTPTLALADPQQLATVSTDIGMRKRLIAELKKDAAPRAMTALRKDHPTIRPAKGGSLERALAAASPNERTAALANLKQDVYAQSNNGPQLSRMKTWNQIAQAWGMPPMPMTIELIEAVGASFKQGGYRSAHLYFAAAKKDHTMREGSFPPDLEIKIRDTIRSIERGQGPAKLKDGFDIQDLTNINLYKHSPRFETNFHTVVVGCYFLTREIELSATLRKHVRIDTQRKVVSWTLPAMKTSTRGELTERSHKCMCNMVSHKICPYHSMKRLMELNPVSADTEDTAPLIHHDGEPLNKMAMIQNIREVLQAARIPTTREGLEGPVERFGGHALRVSGSQHMTRLGFPTNLIMLLGRWGSMAILRYIQDSPLQAMLSCTPGTPASNTNAPGTAGVEPELKKMKTETAGVQADLGVLKARLRELETTVTNLNRVPTYVVGKKAHTPDPRESELPPLTWTSKCGWNYGASKFTRSDQKINLCIKCFPGESADEAAVAESSSSSSSSSSD